MTVISNARQADMRFAAQCVRFTLTAGGLRGNACSECPKVSWAAVNATLHFALGQPTAQH